MIKVLAVAGPTATGKTELAIKLAKYYDGEIISCDSMQIYRGMDIGTAKPSKDEMSGIPHHLMDIISPETDFSCADYASLAKEAVKDISSRGKLPVFCGGTGLYLDSALSGDRFAPPVSDDIREELNRRSPEELYAQLKEVDPESAEWIHPNNVKRVIRALEVYLGTGVTKSEWDRRSKELQPAFDAYIIGLDCRDRQKLYDRINLRVDMMLEAGLCDEVKRLDLKRDSTAAQAIGYKELYLWLDGFIGYDDAVELLKKNTRNYAKRQLTWFRRNPAVHWYYIDGDGKEELYENIVNNINNEINIRQNMV